MPEISKSAQRRTLLIIGLMFVLPVALSFYLYYKGWRPTGTANHGELITPPRALPAIALRDSNGNAVEQPFEGAWTLIYVGPGNCDAGCRQALYVMRQVRLALNRDSERVRRVFLYQGDCCDEAYFAAEQQGLTRIDVDSADGKLVQVFSAPVPPGESGRIWLADPHGNLMMSYPPGADPKGLLEDLKRLLRLSHIG